MRDGATQAGIVDIDIERVGIVDRAKLVVDAGDGLREAVIELGLRVCRGGLVLVFQPEGGHVGVGPTGDSGVEGLLVVLQGLVAQVSSHTEHEVVLRAALDIRQEDIVNLYSGIVIVLCQDGAVRIIRVRCQPFAAYGGGRNDTAIVQVHDFLTLLPEGLRLVVMVA